MIDPKPDDVPLALVVPFLRTFPSVNVWHFGCPVAEDPYWTAFVLQEELGDRVRIYVTDQEEDALVSATEFGERGALARLRKRMTFFQWDSATDGSFNEFQLVVARAPPSERGFTMIHASICRFGVLDVGQGSSLALNLFAACYEPLDRGGRMYRRTR